MCGARFVGISAVLAVLVSVSLFSSVTVLTTPLPVSGQTTRRAGQALPKANLDLPFDMPDHGFSFYGEDFEGDGVFYAIDRSGSMQNSGELQRAKQEVVRNLSSFSELTSFGISFFDKGLVQHPASGVPSAAFEKAKAGATAWVMGTPGGGGSCVATGLTAALLFAGRSSARRNVVIYLGDGCTTCPGRDSVSYAAQSLTVLRGLNVKNVPVHTFVVGPDSEVCPSFPQMVSLQNNGTFFRLTR
jgi:hypothetical protein